MFRAARGAIVVPENTRDAILASTGKVVEEMMARNHLALEQVVSVIFTATEDLDAVFPAEAARGIGFTTVPLLCAREIAVPGAMARVVRVLMHFESDDPEIAHVYLDGAERLRDDLA